MKKIFTFLLAVLITAINASAGAVFSDGGKTLTLTDCSNRDFNNLNSTQLAGVETLIIVGYISGNKFPGFVNNVKERLKVLDMSGMDANEVAENYDEIKKMSSINTIKFPDDLETIPANLCEGFSSLTSVTLPTSLKTIGANAFQACSSLQEITLPYGLETIRGHAFDNSGLVSISIPGTVKLIEADAFSVCNDLSKVVFEEVHEGDPAVNMTIRGNAFQNANSVWDVYVETEGTIHCDNYAFSLNITNGHGDPNSKLSSLHFPADKAEDYVNMKHVLTAAIAASPERFHNWLNDHLDKAQTAANGWYEFANSGPSPDPNEPPISQYFLKTWSESGDPYTGYYKASTDELFETQVEGSEFVTYYMGRLVPDGVRAYIVNSITSENVTTSNGTTEPSFKVTLKRLRVIPANTGVILYGQANSLTKENAPALTMPQVPYIGLPLTRDNWTVKEIDGNEQQSKLKNFLIGTGDNEELVQPYDYKDGTTEVEFRNFFLGDFSRTSVYQNNATKEGWTIEDDYVGFFRAKRSTLGIRKAYLHLKSSDDEFNDPNGNECIVVPDPDYDREPSNTSAALMDPKSKTIPGTSVKYWEGRFWTGAPAGNDWGVRNTEKKLDDYLASFRGEFEGEVDGIVTLTIPAEVVNDVYYTLQGVKVTNPTKSGIYIKNGKKVIIK